MNDVIACARQHFTLQLSDLSAVGWIITLLYFYCVGLIVFMLRRLRQRATNPDRRLYLEFWIIVAALYLFLGLNKQFDFQTILTATGRCVSRLEGWYDDRRKVQLTAVLAGVFVCTIAMFLMRWRFGPISHRLRLAFLGVGVSCLFIVLRAISFHHVDQVFSIKLADIKLHVLIETLGILLVSANAIMLAFKPMRRNFPNQENSSLFDKDYAE
jgi:hypothetical protein